MKEPERTPANVPEGFKNWEEYDEYIETMGEVFSDSLLNPKPQQPPEESGGLDSSESKIVMYPPDDPWEGIGYTRRG